MKKIILAGEVHSHNVGDQAIHSCLAYLLRSLDPNISVISLDISGREIHSPDSLPTRKSKLFSLLNAWLGDGSEKAAVNFAHHLMLSRFKQIRLWSHILENADMLVIGGGQLLMDNALDFPLKLSNLASLAQARGIPVHISAVGVGKKWSPKARRLFQPLLENATSITVRDNLSHERLSTFQPFITSSVTADPAILAAELFPVSLSTSDRIGLGVMSREDANSRLSGSARFSKKAWCNLWLDEITRLIEENNKVEIFTTGSPQDEYFAKQLFHAAQQRFSESISLAACPCDTNELIRTMQAYTLVIASRLHASILANAIGISSLGLVWDEKVQSYYDESGLSERCFKLVGLKSTDLVSVCQTYNKQPFCNSLLTEMKNRAFENGRIILAVT